MKQAIKDLIDQKNNPVFNFVKKHKMISIVIVAILGAFIIFADDNSSSNTTKSQYPEVDVNGLVINEACEKLRSKGWRIDKVYHYGNEGQTVYSDCSNSVDRAVGVSFSVDEATIKMKDKDAQNEPKPKQQESKPESKKENKPSEPVSQSTPKQESKPVRHKISQDAAELYCQDAGLLNKYIDSSKISTIYVTNYNKKYTDSFRYDKEGNPIWFFQWNGRNKSSNETIRFSCWVSGSNDKSIKLHRLTIGGNTVVGETFEAYNEKGELVE